MPPNPTHHPFVAAVAAAGVLLGGCSGATDNNADDLDDSARTRLQQVVDAEHRSAANRARDTYRNPVETLTFFGIQPDMTVVELWPFGGWYTEILAPYLRENGRYYAAAIETAPGEDESDYNVALRATLSARPELFDRVEVTELAPGNGSIAPPGSADMVLTFRNIHNWRWAETERDVFAEAFRALKPGGILGVVEHRHDDPGFNPTTRGQAYVGEQWAVDLIESVGFELVARSEINANPRDTKDHPSGVWTLPPYYAMGDEDRGKYEAIGESDRFTLKFVRPVR